MVNWRGCARPAFQSGWNATTIVLNDDGGDWFIRCCKNKFGRKKNKGLSLISKEMGSRRLEGRGKREEGEDSNRINKKIPSAGYSRNLNATRLGNVYGILIPRVRVTENAHARI